MANFIQKSITITWDEKPHVINITNELCNSLEANGINLFKIYVDLLQGGTPKMFMVGDLITKLLYFGAGVYVEQDKVMKKLTRDVDTSIELTKFANGFLSKVFPEDESADVGKPEKVKAKAKK